MFIFICATPRKMFKIPGIQSAGRARKWHKGPERIDPGLFVFFSLIPAISGNDGNFVCERY
jgi:hypothetical protein